MPGLATEKCYVCCAGGWRNLMKKDGDYGALVLWRHDYCPKDEEKISYYGALFRSHYRIQAQA